MADPSKGSLIPLCREGGGSHPVLKSYWEINYLLLLKEEGGVTPNFILGCDPPPPSICIMKKEGEGGSHPILKS